MKQGRKEVGLLLSLTFFCRRPATMTKCYLKLFNVTMGLVIVRAFSAIALSYLIRS